VRDTIGTGIYFVTYESAKQMLANARGNSPTTPLAVVIAGGLCGLVSWACVSEGLYVSCTEHSPDILQIFPIDTAKSIYQRNCLTSGRDKATRPKIQFFNARMYRGNSFPLIPYRPYTDHCPRPRRVDEPIVHCKCYFLFRIRVYEEAHQSDDSR
jgi:hypothetical protein